jgi:lipase
VTLIEPVMFAAVQAFLGMWGDGSSWEDISEGRRAALVARIHLIPEVFPAIDDDVHGFLARLAYDMCPVDLIEGSDSQKVMTAILDGLASRMPHACRYEISGAVHMVPITHAAVVASVL